MSQASIMRTPDVGPSVARVRRSWRVARVAGIAIDVHVSWRLVFGLIVWSLAAEYFPTHICATSST